MLYVWSLFKKIHIVLMSNKKCEYKVELECPLKPYTRCSCAGVNSMHTEVYAGYSTLSLVKL